MVFLTGNLSFRADTGFVDSRAKHSLSYSSRSVFSASGRKPASRTRDCGRLNPCRGSMSAKSPRHSLSFIQANSAALPPRHGLTGSWISIGDDRPSHSLRPGQRAIWRSEWPIGSMSDHRCDQTVFAGIGGESFFRQDLEICKEICKGPSGNSGCYNFGCK